MLNPFFKDIPVKAYNIVFWISCKWLISNGFPTIIILIQDSKLFPIPEFDQIPLGGAEGMVIGVKVQGHVISVWSFGAGDDLARVPVYL